MLIPILLIDRRTEVLLVAVTYSMMITRINIVVVTIMSVTLILEILMVVLIGLTQPVRFV